MARKRKIINTEITAENEFENMATPKTIEETDDFYMEYEQRFIDDLVGDALSDYQICDDWN